MPGKKSKERAMSVWSKATDKIQKAADSGKYTKKEIQQMVTAHNQANIGTTFKGGGNANINFGKIKFNTAAEKTPKMEATERKTTPSSTLGEYRQSFYNDEAQEGAETVISEGTKDLSADRKAQLRKDLQLQKNKKTGQVSESYITQLKNKVKEKYGDDYQGNQMAMDAMLDEKGEIAPMSSAAGQSSAMPKKRGFAMKGFPKHKLK